MTPAPTSAAPDLARVVADLPSLALAVWVGAAACGVEFGRVAFG